jgi:hypothetical protein
LLPTAIWSDTPDAERVAALSDLAARRVNIVFSVDLFNEGVNIPAVDTLLMLRPTDSPTLFLQQLGRGLRRSVGKDSLYGARLRRSPSSRSFGSTDAFRRSWAVPARNSRRRSRRDFRSCPPAATWNWTGSRPEIVLESIRNAVPSRWTERIAALRQLTTGGATCSLARYLEETGLDLDDVYSGNKSWSDLCAEVGLVAYAAGTHEQILRRACGRLLHIDDLLRIRTYERLLSSTVAPDPAQMPQRERRLLRMLVGSVVSGAVKKDTSLHEGACLLWNHPQVLSELRDLMEVLATRIQHVVMSLLDRAEVPLEVHGRYTKAEILAAFGVGEGARVAPWQTGVYWVPDAGADLFAFTLDKTTGQFSPTTRYRDYAISPDLIHWESQSVTRADSATGRRYQHHVETGSSVMLFARGRSDDRAFYFLGPAVYVRHESELPMAITWRLQHALPGDLFATFAAAVA